MTRDWGSRPENVCDKRAERSKVSIAEPRFRRCGSSHCSSVAWSSSVATSTWGKQWDRKVKFRDLLSGDTSDENAIRVGKRIAGRVSNAAPEGDRFRDDDLADIIERLNEVEDRDELNDCLSDLYDWVDCGRRLFVEF